MSTIAPRANSYSCANLETMAIDYLSPASAWVEHIPFAYWLTAVLRPRVFVELGTHAGDSFFAFCQAASAIGLDARLHAVDSWAGDEHAGFYDGDIHGTVDAYARARYPQLARLIRATFDDAVAQFDDGTIDLLHIDGLHTYEAVARDFHTWLPKLSPHAVVLFHDTQSQVDGFNVNTFWREIGRHYPSFEFTHGGGLGVLCPGSQPRRDIIERLSANGDATRNYYASLGACITAARSARRHTARLYLDYGAGYTNESSLTESVDVARGLRTLHFHIPRHEALRGRALRIDPLEVPAVVAIRSIRAFAEDGAEMAAAAQYHNAFLRQDTCYFFDSSDPFVFIDVETSERQPCRLVLELEYLAVGAQVADFTAAFIANAPDLDALHWADGADDLGRGFARLFAPLKPKDRYSIGVFLEQWYADQR